MRLLKKNNLDNSLWIETGTYYGDTTNLLSNISSKVISIEADKRLYDLAVKKFQNTKNIQIINNKSQSTLDGILKNNQNHKNLCIYLDAHLCMDHLTKEPTFKEENLETPIMDELNIIETYLTKFDRVNILVDDIRLFDGKTQNYPNLNEIVDWARKNKSNWFIEHDIFIIKFQASSV